MMAEIRYNTIAELDINVNCNDNLFLPKFIIGCHSHFHCGLLYRSCCDHTEYMGLIVPFTCRFVDNDNEIFCSVSPLRQLPSMLSRDDALIIGDNVKHQTVQ